MVIPYWQLSGFYGFYFALLGATAPFYGLYFAFLGFAPERIGELVAIPMLMRCLAPNLWGWIGDHTGWRLGIVRLGALCALLAFLPLWQQREYQWLALFMALHAFFWHAILPQFEVITLGHLQGQAHRYSQLRLWGSVGFIVAVSGLGILFEHISLSLWPQLVSLILLGLLLSAWLVPPVQGKTVEDGGAKDSFLAQVRRPGILVFFLCVGLMQLSHGPYYTFISIHLEQLGYGRTSIGLLWSLGVLAEIGLFLFMGRILARVSLHLLLLSSLLLAVLRWLLLGYLADVWPLLVLAQLLHAATFGSFHVASIHFIQASFHRRQQGQGQALYATLSGIGGACGALYAGYSWEALGPAWTFAIAAAAALLAALIICRQPNNKEWV